MADEGGREALARELAEARATIEAQAREIEALRAGDASGFAEALRRTLTVAGSAERLLPSTSHRALLELVVRAAMRVIGTDASGLLLIDRAANDLVFEVVIGGGGEAIARQRVPLGQGIAGWVALTGQPLSVADTSKDARFSQARARSVGYMPRNILCVALQHEDEIIGVLQVLDKQGGDFTPADMETLALFADQATVAIQQSLTYRGISALLARVIDGMAAGGTDGGAALERAMREYIAALDGDPRWRDALALAQLVERISGAGTLERRLCQGILAECAEYVRRRSQPFGLGLGSG